MSIPAPPSNGRRGRVWIRATETTIHGVVCSRVGYFSGHWSARLRRSVRCLGDVCPVCISGEEPRPFYYIFVELDDGSRGVFEIPTRHFEFAEWLDETESGGVGVRIAIWKDGKAKNSPLNLRSEGFEEVDELDIWPFVQTLGSGLVAVDPTGATSAPRDPLKSVSDGHGDARAM